MSISTTPGDGCYSSSPNPSTTPLARALPAAVEEIRRVHGPQPFTLVFDRGGYSGDAFRFLQQQNIGFITYLRGRSARRRYAGKKFRPGWFFCEDRRHTYRLLEKKTRVRRVGSLRTILFLGDEGQQIPLLTNLAPTSRAAQVVYCLGLRWRQENSFKFLSQHYAIDQIVQYGAHPETQDRLVPNPKRKALQQQVRACRQRIEALEAQLGRAVEGHEERRRPTVRGLKTAHARRRRQIAQQRQVLARLENRLRHTPGRISAAQVDRTRALLREDRRLIVNALKIAAAQRRAHAGSALRPVLSAPSGCLQRFPGSAPVTGPSHAHRTRPPGNLPAPTRLRKGRAGAPECPARSQPRIAPPAGQWPHPHLLPQRP